MKRREFLALGAAFALPAFSQSRYPDRPIRLVVPFAPGGEVDLVARLWAKHAAPLLGGASIVVENKAGAGGSIGASEGAGPMPPLFGGLPVVSGAGRCPQRRGPAARAPGGRRARPAKGPRPTSPPGGGAGLPTWGGGFKRRSPRGGAPPPRRCRRC